MEPETSNTSIEQEVEDKSSLHTVTTFSKYLALALFIILPFVGGWIGYQYAPEKVVEIERVLEVSKAEKEGVAINTESEVVVEPPIVGEEDYISEQLLDTDYSTWRTYFNEEYGFTFSYPPEFIDLSDLYANHTFNVEKDLNIKIDTSPSSFVIEKYGFEGIFVASINKNRPWIKWSDSKGFESFIDDWISYEYGREGAVFTVDSKETVLVSGMNAMRITGKVDYYGQTWSEYMTFVDSGSLVFKFRNKPSDANLESATSVAAVNLQNSIVSTFKMTSDDN